MEIKQLEIFTVVAKRLSFSKAAEELYISQPTVSAQVSSLEKTLGAQLLIRNTKGVSLTKVGEDFLAYAQKILTLRDQALQSANNSDSLADGVIDIIASTIPAQHLLPDMIAEYQKHRPNVIFRVEQADSGRVQTEMTSFKYDFGMIGTMPDRERFNFYPIFEDELVLVTPLSFPDISDGNLSNTLARNIADSPFIMREHGSGTRVEVEGLLSKIGVELRQLHIPAYFSDSHSILSAVTSGLGVSLVSKIAATMYVKAGLVKEVRLDKKLSARKIFLIYNKELWLSPIQQAFVAQISI